MLFLCRCSLQVHATLRLYHSACTTPEFLLCVSFLTLFFFVLFDQAVKLASYRPHLNTSHLVDNLERLQEMVDEAHTLFKGMRIMTVYYEDVVQNRTVSMTPAPFSASSPPPLSLLLRPPSIHFYTLTLLLCLIFMHPSVSMPTILACGPGYVTASVPFFPLRDDNLTAEKHCFAVLSILNAVSRFFKTYNGFLRCP